MNSIKVGDIVTLKSGGPYMTITEDYGNGWVKTVWFDNNKINYGEFHKDTLNIENE